MPDRAKHLAAAGLLAALVPLAALACDGGTEPTDTTPPDTTTAAPLGDILVPRPGRSVNRTTPPESPFSVRAEPSAPLGADYTVDAIAVEWRYPLSSDTAVLGTGAERQISLPSGIEPVGEHPLVARFYLRGDPSVFTEETTSFRIARDSLALRILEPEYGMQVEVGEPVSCVVQIDYNPRRYDVELEWESEAANVLCNENDDLVSGPSGVPVSETLALGEHVLTVRGTVPDRTVSASDTTMVLVVEPPPQVVFGNSAAGDFYTIKLVDGEAEAERLTFDGAPKNFPDISPDGTRLVYVQEQSDHDNCYLYIRNLETNQTTNLVYSQANDCRAVKWSPDGSRIAFTGGYEDPNFENDYQTVFTINADGSGFHVVAPRTCNADFTNKPCTGGTGSWVAWHPEGLILTRAEHIRSDPVEIQEYVAIVDLATGEDIRRLHEDPINAQRGLLVTSISPDNRLVTFESDKNQIHVLRTDGSGAVGVFMAQTQALFCGSSDWVYYPDAEDGRIVFRRVHPDGTGDEIFTLTDVTVMAIPRCIPQN